MTPATAREWPRTSGNPTARDAAMLATGWTRRKSGVWHHRATGILVHRHESGWRAVAADGAVLVTGATLGSVADVALRLVNGGEG